MNFQFSNTFYNTFNWERENRQNWRGYSSSIIIYTKQQNKLKKENIKRKKQRSWWLNWRYQISYRMHEYHNDAISTYSANQPHPKTKHYQLPRILNSSDGYVSLLIFKKISSFKSRNEWEFFLKKKKIIIIITNLSKLIFSLYNPTSTM